MEKVFQFFTDRLPNKRFRHLLVAPFNMRDRFMELINEEIRNAKKGLPAYMILKMNALQDERMIRKLYEAGKAGVKVELIVRGICCLVPGQRGLSENITVRSIIDRYLEHARVYIFCNNNQEKLYVASADWMTRNLNRGALPVRHLPLPGAAQPCFCENTDGRRGGKRLKAPRKKRIFTYI